MDYVRSIAAVNAAYSKFTTTGEDVDLLWLLQVKAAHKSVFGTLERVNGEWI